MSTTVHQFTVAVSRSNTGAEVARRLEAPGVESDGPGMVIGRILRAANEGDTIVVTVTSNGHTT